MTNKALEEQIAELKKIKKEIETEPDYGCSSSLVGQLVGMALSIIKQLQEENKKLKEQLTKEK